MHKDSVNPCFKCPQQIRQELLDSQLKVASLQDMSLQLLVNSQGSDCLEAKEKVHVIGNRLKLLLKEVTRDLRELAKILDITSSQQVGLHSWTVIHLCRFSSLLFARNSSLGRRWPPHLRSVLLSDVLGSVFVVVCG